MSDEDERLFISVSCDRCVHYKNNGIKMNDKGPVACSVLGVSPTQPACVKFSPDPRAIDVWQSPGPVSLAALMYSIPNRELGVLASLVRQEAITRSHGFFYGQPVIIQVFPGDFVSNFAKAKIIFANRSHVYVHAGTFVAMLTRKGRSILSVDEWEKKCAALVRKQRINDPKNESRFRIEASTVDYESIRTIDSFEDVLAAENSVVGDGEEMPFYGDDDDAPVSDASASENDDDNDATPEGFSLIPSSKPGPRNRKGAKAT